MWHILDHAYDESGKNEEEAYTVLRLRPKVAPIDVAILPLMDKDGLEDMATKIHQDICSVPQLISYYDGSGSIGRRYARADEIGVPWAVTVDHQSLKDDTVTVRRRDDGAQIRMTIQQLIDKWEQLESLF